VSFVRYLENLLRVICDKDGELWAILTEMQVVNLRTKKKREMVGMRRECYLCSFIYATKVIMPEKVSASLTSCMGI
jgi:hypothetical protein